MSRYNTNLAAEFYVLSMLHRLGADAALTLGNKKAVDIFIAKENGTITIEVKGVAKRYDWPANNVREFANENHFYVLVCFEGKIDEPEALPSVWIIPAKDMKPFMRLYKTRLVVSRAEVNAKGQQYLYAWEQVLGGN